jgi:two-component system sensor histidine kinase MprB
MPLRARLALLTAVAVAIAVAAVATTAWFLTRDQLLSQMDQTLRESRVRDVQTSDEPGGQRPPPPLPRQVDPIQLFCNGGFEDTSQAQIPTPQTNQLVGPDNFSCAQYPAFPFPVTQSDRDVANGVTDDVYREATDANGTHLRVLTRQATVHGEPGYALSVARPLTEIDNTLKNLAIILVVVSGIGVLLSATIGLLVARAALRPVDQLTDAVEHIARTEDLDTTIPVEGEDEIARLGSSFNAMTSALKASRERQQQLIADAGHELRTPLTSLRTNTDLLLRSEEQGRPLPADDKKRLLRNVRGQLRELSGLVGDLLELARPERARSAPPTGSAGLHIAVEQAVERARMRGQNTVIDADLNPWYVRGDEYGLERAVLNLLDNAIKFGPPDGTIEVRLRDGELTVRDRGPGIDPEDAPHVFDRFWRSTSARALPGSGLGLAIVARTVQESGGTVSLEPAPGGGTLARVRLPGTAMAPGAPS